MFLTKHYLDDVFNSFFSRPSIYVVSDTQMKKGQEEQKDRNLKAIDDQIERLQEYRKEVEKYYNDSLKLDFKTTEDEKEKEAA